MSSNRQYELLNGEGSSSSLKDLSTNKKIKQFGGWRVGITSFFTLAMGFVLLVFTFMQWKDNESTPFNNMEGICDQAKAPVKFRVDGDTEFITCGWNARNNWTRMTFAFISIALIVVSIVLIYKKKRVLIYLFSVVSLLMALSMFYTGVVDATSLKNSNCKELRDGIACTEFQFVLLCSFDFIAGLVWVIQAIMVFFHVRNHMNTVYTVSPSGDVTSLFQ
eukprot:TRINITY_DN5423_c0_g1_i1.p1 TRINITY_DN5423_c0_g1~~TRINITY_DN5423_c0_g1_i1.p1  ORF type:complete len:220 (-),score=48.12 TRINITY_DN5423_c0_g1_i1:45-704(-)